MLNISQLRRAVVRCASAQRKAYVVGVGMTKFEKPGRRIDFDYHDMGREAGEAALADAGLPFEKVEAASGTLILGFEQIFEVSVLIIQIYF